MDKTECVGQSHYTGRTCMLLAGFESACKAISFPSTGGPAPPHPLLPWSLPTQKLRIDQASGVAGSDRNVQPPVSAHDPGTQGPSLGREHGGSTLLKGENGIHWFNRNSLYTGLWVPWDQGLFYFIFCFAWGLTQCRSYVNVCWVEIQLKTHKVVIQTHPGFNSPSPCVQMHSDSLAPSLSFPMRDN